ncbi:hypothetical protein FOWG_08440 [Fusarium oxysporum f. sp. lycopersici MN25]|nr:hypothetical protein FOWG_08440 [Fusarium oxysporum f. sp. lycopersici MN25]
MSDLDARLAAMSHWGNEGVCLLVLETGLLVQIKEAQT